MKTVCHDLRMLQAVLCFLRRGTYGLQLQYGNDQMSPRFETVAAGGKEKKQRVQ